MSFILSRRNIAKKNYQLNRTKYMAIEWYSIFYRQGGILTAAAADKPIIKS